MSNPVNLRFLLEILQKKITVTISFITPLNINNFHDHVR